MNTTNNQTQKLRGFIDQINPLEQVTNKFVKQEFVVKTNEKYPSDILFQLNNDNCKLMQDIYLGREVDVHFNVKGKRVNINGIDKFYNTLVVWKIELVESHG